MSWKILGGTADNLVKLFGGIAGAGEWFRCSRITGLVVVSAMVDFVGVIVKELK